MDDLDYYDTSVLVSSMRPEESQRHEISADMIRDVESGKKVLVLPMWALLELIDAMKRLIARRSKPKNNTLDQVEKKIKDTVKYIIDFVTKMQQKGNIIIFRNNEPVHEYYEKIYKKLKQYPIRVVKRDGQYKLGSMGFRDIGHLYHAQKSGKVRFCTWDKGFGDALDDEDFDRVAIKVLELPREQSP